MKKRQGRPPIFRRKDGQIIPFRFLCVKLTEADAQILDAVEAFMKQSGNVARSKSDVVRLAVQRLAVSLGVQ